MARLEAYEKSMLALGLKPGPILHGDLRFEGGLAAGLAIAGMSPRPTAVMAINDLTAVGVMKGLTSAGCRIPQDISVTGFDRTRLAEYSIPSLTTVDIHRDLLGKWPRMPCMNSAARRFRKAGNTRFCGIDCGTIFGTGEALAVLSLLVYQPIPLMAASDSVEGREFGAVSLPC